MSGERAIKRKSIVTFSPHYISLVLIDITRLSISEVLSYERFYKVFMSWGKHKLVKRFISVVVIIDIVITAWMAWTYTGRSQTMEVKLG